jgi:hypothetical protein
MRIWLAKDPEEQKVEKITYKIILTPSRQENPKSVMPKWAIIKRKLIIAFCDSKQKANLICKLLNANE